MIKYAVVGSPRSGTHWAAQVLGVPHEPEPVWGQDFVDGRVWQSATDKGFVSCWLTPFTKNMQAEGVRAIHLIRHPMQVAESLVGANMVTPDLDTLIGFHGFISKHIGDGWTKHRTPGDRALAFWLAWTDLADSADRVWLVGKEPPLRVPYGDLSPVLNGGTPVRIIVNKDLREEAEHKFRLLLSR